MNNEQYLSFINELVKRSALYEDYALHTIVDDRYISKEHTTLIAQKETFITVEIPLSNNNTLLLEASPLSFLLAHTILIGEDTHLVAFTVEGKVREYIATKTLFSSIKDKFTVLSTRSYNPTKLAKQHFTFPHKAPFIMQELLNYIKDNTKLDMNIIQLVPNDKLELFTPSLKQEHLTLAKKNQNASNTIN